MTSKERILRTCRREPIDRIPFIDAPWAGTLARWHREGLPAGIDWRDYFGVDKCEGMGFDVSPRFERKILEETDQYIISTSAWGATLKELKDADATPEFLDFKVTDPEKWLLAKVRMDTVRDRVDWDRLKKEYPRWVAEGCYLEGRPWFGFDVTHSWFVGTETLLVAMLEEPEWVMDMFDVFLTNSLRLLDMMWDEGYRFDGICWPDDMGYKGTPFFSKEMYRSLVQPFHKRAVDWAHNHGILAQMHSCGDIRPLLPDLIATGLDILNPLEVKAGMDAIAIKKTYGDKLALRGGINAAIWHDLDAVTAEIRRLVPALKEGGGYIFASDHSIPNDVSFETFSEIVRLVKEVGSY